MPGYCKRKASDSQPDAPAGVPVGDASGLKGVYARAVKDKLSGTITHYKYKPRFIPPREEVDEGTTTTFNRLYLGEYHTPAEAKVVLQIARFYYNKDGGCVELENGQYKFSIPPISEQERGFTGEEKRKWVTCKAKQVGKQIYAEFRKAKAEQMVVATERGSHADHGNGVGSSDPSPSALPITCSSLYMIASTGTGNEPAIVSEAPSCQSLSLRPFDDALVGHGDDSSGVLFGFEDMIAELFDSSLPNLSAQKKQRDNSAVQFENLGRQVKVFQIRISKLQQENERLEQEKELLQLERQHDKEVFKLEKKQLNQKIELLERRLQLVAKISSCSLD